MDLVFIGFKVFLGDFVFEGKVHTLLSLSIKLGILYSSIAYSSYKTKEQKPT